MRKRHADLPTLGLAAAVGALGACQPMVDASDYAAEEFESTYSTAVRVDLPQPAGEGDAPLAGSLGPPEDMVEPEILGETTITREGSSGPPIRSATEPTPAPSHSTTRQYLRGHDYDAHRVRPGVRRPRPESAQPEPAQPEPARPESAQPESAQPEPARD